MEEGSEPISALHGLAPQLRRQERLDCRRHCRHHRRHHEHSTGHGLRHSGKRSRHLRHLHFNISRYRLLHFWPFKARFDGHQPTDQPPDSQRCYVDDDV